MNLLRQGSVMLQAILRGKEMSQRDIYRHYLQVSHQLSEIPDDKNRLNPVKVELELILDLLWNRMDGYAKRHHG